MRGRKIGDVRVWFSVATQRPSRFQDLQVRLKGGGTAGPCIWNGYRWVSEEGGFLREEVTHWRAYAQNGNGENVFLPDK